MAEANIKKKYGHFKYLIFVLPVLIPWFILALYPNLQVFWLSFYKWNGVSENMKFVGLDNFKILTYNPDLPFYVLNTILYLIFLFVVQQTLAVCLALILKENSRISNFFRTLYFFPIVLSTTAVAMIWSYMYDSQLGVLNYILNSIGLKSVLWLSTPALTILCAVVVQIWQGIGTQLVIYLAAIKSIPESLYESASIEGANTIYTFFRITLPLLVPTILRLAYLTILSAFTTFEFMYLLFQWGTSSRDIITLPLYLFNEIQNQNVGIPSAIGFVISTLMIIVFICQYKITKKVENSIY